MTAIAISPPEALSGDSMYEVIVTHWLKGTVWGSWAGQVFLFADLRFYREHGSILWGPWEFREPNIVYLRADPGDSGRAKFEKFELVDYQLRSCVKSGGLIYSLVKKRGHPFPGRTDSAVRHPSA